MLFTTLDQVVWLTSSEGLNPRVNRTKGALTKRILCPEWLSPCHQAMPHALSYTHGETGLVQLSGCSTCRACILHCTTHVFSSAFTVPGKPFFQRHVPPDLCLVKSALLWKQSDWCLQWNTSDIFISRTGPCFYVRGKVRGTREAQTFLRGTHILEINRLSH